MLSNDLFITSAMGSTVAYIAIQQYIKLNGNMYSTYKKEKDFFFVFLDVEYVLGALCKIFFSIHKARKWK